MLDLKSVKPADLWYVIGYIATDGYLSIDGRHINITSKDRKHLFKIRNALNLENIIGKKSRANNDEKSYSQLQFGDVKFYQHLKNLGLSSRKSLTMGPLVVDDKFFADFLRGIIDGDGSISCWIHKDNFHKQWCLRVFSASRTFIEWLNQKIRQEYDVEGRLYSNKAKDRINAIYTLKFGKLNSLRILERIYYKGSLALDRKFDRAQLCLQERGKMLNYTLRPR